MFPSLGCFIYSFSPCNRVLVEYGSVLLMFMCISHVHKYRVGVKIGQAGKYPGPRICDDLEMAPYADKVATVGGTHMHRRTRRGAEDPSA